MLLGRATSPKQHRRPSSRAALSAFRSNRRLQAGLGLIVLVCILWADSRRAGKDELGAGRTGGGWFGRGRNGGRMSSSRFPKLPELEERDRLWPPDLDKPLCDLKIYVYSPPQHLLLPAAKIAKCRWSAYSSSLLLHSLLVSPNSPISDDMATTNPAEADYFFVPLFPACYLFNCWDSGEGWDQERRCGVDEEYIGPVMDWVKSQELWRRKGGRDHLIVHPMDRADAYYSPASRMAMENSTYLVTVGDRRPPPHSSYYRHKRDIVVPSATHLLHSYFVNPMNYLDDDGAPLATPLRELDDTTLPTGIEIFSPTLPRPASSRKGRKTRRRWNGRSTIAVFRGGLGSPTDGENYSLDIRTLFYPSTSSHPSFRQFSPHPGFSSLPLYDIAPSSSNADYALALSQSRYGLAPPGYTLDTTRLYEYLAFGVVPIFLGTGSRAGQVLPFEDDFDWNGIALFVERERVHELPEIIASIGEAEYERMRKKVWDVGRRLVLEEKKGEVWKWIARDLCRRKFGGE